MNPTMPAAMPTAARSNPLPPPLDRVQTALVLAGGAVLGYLILLDWAGLWFHHPLWRYPCMLLGALLMWGIFMGLWRDPRMPEAVRRAVWWALIGLLLGYALQLLYLLQLDRLLAGSLSAFGATVKGVITNDRPMLGRGVDQLLQWHALRGFALVGWVFAMLALAAQALAYHLDAGQRDPADPRVPSDRQRFLQGQRRWLVRALVLSALIVAFQSLDPRRLDFAEGLELSWAQQHGAIFGFLAGYATQLRRERRERLAAAAAPPQSRMGSALARARQV